VFEKVLVTEVIRMDIVLASQASNVMGVKGQAALCVHLKACVVLPIEHNANLCVISCEAVSDRSDQVCTFAPLWRLCHTALLADRWAAEHGVLVSVKITEFLGSDLLHACRAVQGFPPAAHNVMVMASTTGPHNFGRDLTIVAGEAVSHCDWVHHLTAPCRLFSCDTTVLPCEADIRMGGSVFGGTIIIRQHASLACKAFQVVHHPAAPCHHLFANTMITVVGERLTNFSVVRGERANGNHMPQGNVTAEFRWIGRATLRCVISAGATWGRILHTVLLNRLAC
jgi:hypothetical protein